MFKSGHAIVCLIDRKCSGTTEHLSASFNSWSPIEMHPHLECLLLTNKSRVHQCSNNSRSFHSYSSGSSDSKYHGNNSSTEPSVSLVLWGSSQDTDGPKNASWILFVQWDYKIDKHFAAANFRLPPASQRIGQATAPYSQNVSHGTTRSLWLSSLFPARIAVEPHHV